MCVFGGGIETPVHLKYEGGTAPFDVLPTVTNGDGDGTVPLRSARLCESWRRRLGDRLQINEVSVTLTPGRPAAD